MLGLQLPHYKSGDHEGTSYIRTDRSESPLAGRTLTGRKKGRSLAPVRWGAHLPGRDFTQSDNFSDHHVPGETRVNSDGVVMGSTYVTLTNLLSYSCLLLFNPT